MHGFSEIGETDIKEQIFWEKWKKFDDPDMTDYEKETFIYELFTEGREILPFLARRLHEGFNENSLEGATTVIAALVTEKDRQILIDLIQNSKIINHHTITGVDRLLDGFNKLNFRLREENKGADELAKSYDILEELFEEPGSDINNYAICWALALTGDYRALNTLKSKLKSRHFLGDMISIVNRHNAFGDWINRTVEIEEPLQYYYADIEKEVLDDSQINDLVNEAFYIVSQFADLEETAKQSALIFTVGYLRSHSEMTEDNLNDLLFRISKISEAETKYKNMPLPSEGIEIEVPEAFIGEIQKKIIKGLDIGTETEGSTLFEIKKSFSYAPLTQSRVLQEMIKLRMIPVQKRIRNGQEILEIPEKVMLSLHLNFGIPEEIEDDFKTRYKNDIDYLVDALVYSFVSPRRILRRKTTGYAWDVKTEDIESNDRTGSCRLEIKILEFNNNNSFRMIEEAQALVGAMFADIKFRKGIPMTEAEQRMAGLWGLFLGEVKAVERKFGIAKALYNTDRQKAAKFAQKEKLQNKMRSLCTEYSRSIKTVIKISK